MEPETTIATSDLAANLGKPAVLSVSDVPFVVLPPGWTSEDAEKFLPEPRRVKSTITAHEVGGLVSYVNRFKSPSTALYSGPRERPQILARIDDHQPGAPSHGTHGVVFSCPQTVEWQTWIQSNKKQMGQVDFAEFVERNLRDIVEPNGAELLTATLAFQDSGKAEFKSAVRLQDGRVQYQFIEKEDAGQLTFPSAMKIGVPVFEGQGERFAVSLRLRYRIKEGALSIWYEMDRPDLVLRAAYGDLIAQVEKETGLAVHRAS